MFEEARKRNPDLKMPVRTPATDGLDRSRPCPDQARRRRQDPAGPRRPPSESGESCGEAPTGEQAGAVVTYFEAKGFGFLRPDDGGRDIFFHVSRLVEGLATDLRPGTRVMYELGMDRTGKMAASSIRIPPPPAA